MDKEQEEYVEPIRRPWITFDEKRLASLIKVNKHMVDSPLFPEVLKTTVKKQQKELLYEFIKRN